MSRSPVLHAVCFSFLISSSLACNKPTGAEGAEHAAEHAELEPESSTVFGDRLLLFLEHAPMIPGEPTRFLAHLSVLANGEPVRAGRVTLRIGTTVLVAETPARDGLFIPNGSLAAPGRFAASLAVESEQGSEKLELGELVVHASHDAAHVAQDSAAGGEPANVVPFLMEQQWKLKLLLATAAPRSMVKNLIVPGQARTPEDAQASVFVPVGGRLFAPPGSAIPRTGDRVLAEQIVGYVEPPLAAGEIAQLQALSLEFDLRALEVVRATGEAQARLTFAQREQERIGKLRAEGLSTQQLLDGAEQNLAVALNDVEAARATRSSLDAMLASRAATQQRGVAAPLHIPLRAPIAGSVIAAHRVAGESVEPGEEILEILDTSSVWVEGRVSEFDLARLAADQLASATFAALPGKRFAAGGSGAWRAWFGPTIDPSSRTLVVRYVLANPDHSIKAGMLAEIAIATDMANAEVSVPLESIVMDQGTPTAYVMLEGELFQKRELELGIADGGFVEVRNGIKIGERVATRGSYAVKLAALSPASFGPGHAH